jgi:type II secretory ATPase GspE/PulE/Tfp pilus assembly ATPase PilB-like protein
MERQPKLLNFLKNAHKESGLTLFVGPTGCGKSTTLYSLLREMASEELKILTCEDPVEQRIEWLSQSSIDSCAGFSFASALRAFLRHDPDVLFIGEIRDRETAELAIRAAITGHCVLSTLHANNATGAVPRLADLGVERPLIAEALLCVVHQRLEKIDTNGKNIENFAGYGRAAKFDALFIDDHAKLAIKNGKI